MATPAGSQGMTSSLPSLDAGLSKDERILRRRDRVEAALAAKREGMGEDDRKRRTASDDVSLLSKGQQQVVSSEERLNGIVETGLSSITMVRVEGDHGENERRVNEEMKAHARQEKLMEEANNAAKRNAAVAMKWATLYDFEVPQELHSELEVQQEACGRIISSKDRLIEEFRAELQGKDQEYVSALRRQADDVDAVIQRMHAHTKEMMQAFEAELREIEASFMQERRELLDSNRERLDSLMEQRRNLEKTLLEKRLRRAEEQSEELDRMRETDAQIYSQLKIDLQRDIQELEQEAEEIRAKYLLNSEKLDYNFQVLSERVVENKLTITQHKRKLARLQDNLSVVMAKCQKAEKQYKSENNELTDMYNRVTKQYKDLQLKFKQFERQDLEKFREVWQMNEEICGGLVHKLVDADRVISTQQLGLDWTAPAADELLEQSPFYAGNSRGGVATSGGGADERPDSMSTASMSHAGPSRQRTSGTPARPLTENVKRMLELLCDEAGFLVEDRVHSMIGSLPQEEQDLVKVDSILKSLGVETQAEVEAMLPYFTKAQHGEDPNRAPLISPEDTVRAIRAYVEDQQRQAARQASAVTMTMEEKAEKKRRDREREFWERLARVIPDQKARLWNALEDGLNKYNKLLTDRQNLLDETEGLRMQNDELRSLLNQYMSAKINEELYVPPILGGQNLYRH